MDSVQHEKRFINQKYLSTDHFNYNFNSHLLNKYKLDENEYYDDHYKKIYDFLSSKFNAMEKINLDYECLIEDENAEKKVNINKIKLPRSQHSKTKKYNNSLKKKNNKKNHSKKKSKNRSNNKNIIINRDGKIKNPKLRRIDSVDIINLDFDKEIKEKELDNFFSNKVLLNSIINEIKGK